MHKRQEVYSEAATMQGPLVSKRNTRACQFAMRINALLAASDANLKKY